MCQGCRVPCGKTKKSPNTNRLRMYWNRSLPSDLGFGSLVPLSRSWQSFIQDHTRSRYGSVSSAVSAVYNSRQHNIVDVIVGQPTTTIILLLSHHAFVIHTTNQPLFRLLLSLDICFIICYLQRHVYLSISPFLFVLTTLLNMARRLGIYDINWL